MFLKYILTPYHLLNQAKGLTWRKQQGTLCCCSGKGLTLPSSIVPRQTEARDTPVLPPLILQKHTRIPEKKSLGSYVRISSTAWPDLCDCQAWRKRLGGGRKIWTFDQDRPSTLFEDEASLSEWLSCPVSYFPIAASQSVSEIEGDRERRGAEGERERNDPCTQSGMSNTRFKIHLLWYGFRNLRGSHHHPVCSEPQSTCGDFNHHYPVKQASV